MQKYRMASWYWGNYCTKTSSGRWIDGDGAHVAVSNYFNEGDLEPYIEEEHGWHNSEEHKIYGKDQNGVKYEGE